jgi:hypothetical protein
MKPVLKNLRNLFCCHRRFAVLILLTQIMGTFAVCFAVGVLYNNQYVLLEDDQTTKRLVIYISAGTDECIYEQVQEPMEQIYALFGDVLEDIDFSYYQYGEEMMIICSSATWDGSAYHIGPTLEGITYQVDEGRNLTEEDFVEHRAVALVTGNYTADTVQVYGKEFEVVGRRMKDQKDYPVVWIPFTCFEGLPVQGVELSMTRIPTTAEYAEVCSILDEAYAGEYRISDYYAGSADEKALYRTTGIAVGGILLAVVGTLLMLYGYVYETRRESLTIMKLCGCKRLQAAGIYIVENLLIAVPACGVGLFVFRIVRELWLDKTYLYIKGLFGIKTYLLCMGSVLLVVFLEAVILAVLRTRGSVKDQLRGEKG